MSQSVGPSVTQSVSQTRKMDWKANKNIIKKTEFWNVIITLVEIYQSFSRICCLHPMIHKSTWRHIARQFSPVRNSDTTNPRAFTSTGSKQTLQLSLHFELNNKQYFF